MLPPTQRKDTDMQVTLDREQPPRAPRSAAQCTASDLLRWLGRADDANDTTDAMVLSMRRVGAGEVLLHEGAAFHHLHFVRAGAFKCFQTDLDGQEQVQTFAWAGDTIGFDGICDDGYGSTATAIEDSLVVAAPFDWIVAAARAEPALQFVLHHCASRELRRRSAALQTLAAVGAEARVARFLLQLAARQASAGLSGRHLRLSMSQRDIGSHLSLRHESVSRSLAVLARGGWIRVARRAVEIVDRAGLTELQHAHRNAAKASGGVNELVASAATARRDSMRPPGKATRPSALVGL
jgi:CRP/FNR family transcriptional regulator